MHLTLWLWISWATVSAVLLLLLLYRSTLTMHEEDQLFIADAANASYEHKEQEELVRKVNRITPAVRFMIGACGVMTGVLILFYAYSSIRILR
jgi:hypothetical protein